MKIVGQYICACFFVIVILYPWLPLLGKWTSSSVIMINVEDDNNKFRDKGALSYQFIDIDNRRGITSVDDADRAKKIISFYFEKTSQECSIFTSTEAFLLCANNVLGDYFSYKVSVSLSGGANQQVSDCDTNSYLLYDIARMFGHEVFVVYSPGHAFISWKERSDYLYLETTGNNNHGSLANMEDAFYKQTLDPFYYLPYSENQLLSIYESIVFLDVSDNERNYIFENDDFLNNPFGLQSFFYQKNVNGKIKELDIKKMESDIDKGLIANSYIYILSEWYFYRGNIEKSHDYLAKIKGEDCSLYCVGIQEKVDMLSDFFPLTLYQLYAEYADTKNIDITKRYFNFLVFTVCLLITTLIFLKKRKRHYQKGANIINCRQSK